MTIKINSDKKIITVTDWNKKPVSNCQHLGFWKNAKEVEPGIYSY